MGTPAHKILVTSTLSAVAILLEFTLWGFIPIPYSSAYFTIMHIPIILAAILAGPYAGAMTGLLYGIVSMTLDTTGLYINPLVAISPRVLIGITAWFVYAWVAQRNIHVAALAAGVTSTIIHTTLIEGFLVIYELRHIEVMPSLIPQLSFEVVFTACISIILSLSKFAASSYTRGK